MTASQYKSTYIKLHVNYTLLSDTDLFIFLTFQEVHTFYAFQKQSLPQRQQVIVKKALG